MSTKNNRTVSYLLDLDDTIHFYEAQHYRQLVWLFQDNYLYRIMRGEMHTTTFTLHLVAIF